MKRSLVIGLLAAVTLSFLASSCITDENDVVVEDRVVVGDSLPEFEVSMSDGTTVSTLSLCEGVSLILFFHTSCPDCQQVIPIVQQIYDEYLPQGVGFAAISREEEADTIASYWEAHGITFPYSAQTTRAIYELFATSRIPRIYICKEGIIYHIFTDNPVATHADIASALDDLMR